MQPDGTVGNAAGRAGTGQNAAATRNTRRRCTDAQAVALLLSTPRRSRGMEGVPTEARQACPQLQECAPWLLQSM